MLMPGTTMATVDSPPMEESMLLGLLSAPMLPGLLSAPTPPAPMSAPMEPMDSGLLARGLLMLSQRLKLMLMPTTTMATMALPPMELDTMATMDTMDSAPMSAPMEPMDSGLLERGLLMLNLRLRLMLMPTTTMATMGSPPMEPMPLLLSAPMLPGLLSAPMLPAPMSAPMEPMLPAPTLPTTTFGRRWRSPSPHCPPQSKEAILI